MQLSKIDIKKIGIKEISVLQEIAIKTFKDTFSEVNSAADMRAYLEESFNTASLALELNNPDSEFFFAVEGKEIMGYLKINFGNAQNELKEENSLEVERIYVLEQFQRKQIGQLMFNKALEIAQNKKVDFVWLGVWEHNTKAMNFYQKNGFEVFDKHSFFFGSDEQTDIMMRLFL